jgi:hypothetical protein
MSTFRKSLQGAGFRNLALACTRHMAQNMLRAETSRKASLRKKQQFAGMSSPYLEKVLDAGLAKLTSI